MTKTIKKHPKLSFSTRPKTPWPEKFTPMIENHLWAFIPEAEQNKWSEVKDLLTKSANLAIVQQTLNEREAKALDANQRLIYSHWQNILANVADIHQRIPNQEKPTFYEWLTQEANSNFTWPGLVSYYQLKKSDWEEVVEDKETQTEPQQELIALQSQVNILRKRLKKANQFNPFPWLVLMGIVVLGWWLTGGKQ